MRPDADIDIGLLTSTLRNCLTAPIIDPNWEDVSWDQLMIRVVESYDEPFKDNWTLRTALLTALIYWLVLLGSDKNLRTTRLHDGEEYSFEVFRENLFHHDFDNTKKYIRDEEEWSKYLDDWRDASPVGLVPTPTNLDKLHTMLLERPDDHEDLPSSPFALIYLYMSLFGKLAIGSDDSDHISGFKEKGVSLDQLGPRPADTTVLEDFMTEAVGTNGLSSRMMFDALPLKFAYQYLMKLESGDRIGALIDLTFPISQKMPIARSFLDSQILQSATKKADLVEEEWLSLICLASMCIDRLNQDTDAYNTLDGDPKQIINAPLNSRTYWAWRFGFVSAMGSHLLDFALASINNQETHPIFAEDNFSPIIPLPLAADLMMSYGSGREWPELRQTIAGVFNRFANWSDDPAVQTVLSNSLGFPLEPPLISALGAGWPEYWSVRMGYVDGMLFRTNRLVLDLQMTPERDTGQVLAFLDLPVDDQRIQPDDFLATMKVMIEQAVISQMHGLSEQLIPAYLEGIWD